MFDTFLDALYHLGLYFKYFFNSESVIGLTSGKYILDSFEHPRIDFVSNYVAIYMFLVFFHTSFISRCTLKEMKIEKKKILSAWAGKYIFNFGNYGSQLSLNSALSNRFTSLYGCVLMCGGQAMVATFNN